MRVENGERVHLGTGPSRKDVWLEGMQAQAAGRMGQGRGPGSREAWACWGQLWQGQLPKGGGNVYVKTENVGHMGEHLRCLPRVHTESGRQGGHWRIVNGERHGQRCLLLECSGAPRVTQGTLKILAKPLVLGFKMHSEPGHSPEWMRIWL